MNDHRRHDVPNQKTLEFFEDRLSNHDAVRSMHPLDKYVYDIERVGRPRLVIYVTDIHILGEAEVSDILHRHPNIDAIVTLSPYNSYTRQAKEYCLEKGIGLYRFKEFMGAVHFTELDFLEYALPSDRDQQYWIKKLRSLFARKKIRGLDDVSIYLFGSSVRDTCPQDLDLLLVYNEKAVTTLQMSNLKDVVRRIVQANTKLKVDVCMLSQEESRESKFVEEEDAVELFPCSQQIL